MQAAKDAVHKFTSKRGHDTTVDENVTGAVTKENIRPHQHEERTQALDREVHQDHYHTTVQPVSHQEQLPEKHTHNLIPTEHREIRHEDPNHSKSQAAAHLAQFQSGSTTHETTRSAENKATVAGEHVHHHVHETVVPVVHKETIQPEVVHTTQPIHETHHAPSQHHGISALPMKSLDEFKSGGGTLDGHAKSAHEEYDGAPRPYNDKLSTTLDKLGFKEGTNSHGQQAQHAGNVNPATGESGIGAGQHSAGQHQTGTHNTSSGLGGAGAGAGLGAGAAAASALDSHKHGHEHTGRDSGVGGLRRSGSQSSSDYEYAADGSKVGKNKLGRHQQEGMTEGRVL
ncbi:uncharacterized protein HMPREF1541_09542 [Cyphellophora europaea CBS 101466]|uniref:Allergen n=1 Tax=Cyphellophora europaea (strain CBS 101466) TaxID=1220924 RepID=W2SCQ1_CYPE1|nr:uncharacterized protein HMPREF1541_09542 [Cyphellophora europaea CBS 101466]ETN45709.1 hypothetical protein HMPREF1541_09542 [Cyphellophora europaea CBS 101466]